MELNRNVTLEQDLHLGLGHRRSKRALWNLYYVLDCVSNCGPFSYNNYGCFCGWGGSGEAIDGIDRCCQLHDECYGTTSCPLGKVWNYNWRCQGNEPICDHDEEDRFEKLSWGQQLCRCDRDFAKCIARFDCQDIKRSCGDNIKRQFIPKHNRTTSSCSKNHIH
ncbi:acidic phospholipase A2 PA-1G-like [Leptopilina heterotoma]|uniref:acidic phospholipase A2 PA-1G-like n=1 Tax=Leptopilina heterotoma TaxID=63436 RepID=UPI001CA98905|nr:acidic phospholipase A2 PA-1G-like [Leptopilina heterotoma]